MKKKLTALVLAIVMAMTTVISATVPVEAATTETVTPEYMKTMDEYNSTVKVSYEHAFAMPYELNSQEKSEVIEVNIPVDSIVRLDVQSFEEGGGMSWGYVSVFTNALLSEKVRELKYSCGKETSPDTYKTLISLKKGTYYFQVIAHRNNYSKVDATINTKLFLTAIPTADAFSVTTKSVSGSQYNLAWESNIGAELNEIYLMSGTYVYEGNSYALSKQGTVTNPIKVSEPGKYSVVFAFGDADYTWDVDAYNSVVINVNVKAVDKTKPTITGVKNGKTYKKAVTIKFKDASGIKSAKLNGKSIKSGTKVSKNGSYTLVVTDKAGNKKTVKFKIKK